jgi:ribosomal peptide maturation radical SAM protein 1
MPWGSVVRPSLAMSLLKSCLDRHGISSDLHYFNMRLANQLGLRQYEKISYNGSIHAEWLFSQALFGDKGTGELKHRWHQLKANPAAEEFCGHVKSMFENSEDLCAKIAEEEIPKFLADCVESVDWGKYDVVGFTSTFAQSLASLCLAKEIKARHPSVQIAFGGANIDSEMGVELLRGFEWVDYAVHGEAEESFPRLLRNIDEGRYAEAVPGVSMRVNGQVVRGDQFAPVPVDLNTNPFPNYDQYMEELTRYGFKNQFDLILYFESSRGCWWGEKHHCTFCGLNGSSMAFRAKTSQRTFEEITTLSKKYRCLSLAATDNILAHESFRELLPMLAGLESDITIFYEVKANLTKDQLRMLRSAGVTSLQPGIESFSTRLLGLMDKGVKAIQNIQLIKWCVELGIYTVYNVLYGFPGEAPADYATLPLLCRMLAHLQPPGDCDRIVFERFSPYFYDRGRFSLTLKPMRGYEFVYADSRVDLSAIAYMFEDAAKGQGAEPATYMDASVNAIRSWQMCWQGQARYFCYYEKGVDYLRITDNRPRGAFGACSTKVFLLDERLAAIYLYCDQHRSFKSIVEFVRARFSTGIDERMLRKLLDGLVVQWLMFADEDRYLSLAIRRRPSDIQGEKRTPVLNITETLAEASPGR